MYLDFCNVPSLVLAMLTYDEKETHMVKQKLEYFKIVEYCTKNPQHEYKSKNVTKIFIVHYLPFSILSNGSGCKKINNKLGSTKLSINHCFLDKENGKNNNLAFTKWTSTYH
jgi:hypothetical protein